MRGRPRCRWNSAFWPSRPWRCSSLPSSLSVGSGFERPGLTFAHLRGPCLNSSRVHPVNPSRGTESMAQKPNSFGHVEIHSNAPEKTKSFLKDVFDWKWQDMPEMNYSMFEAPSAPGGALPKAENLPAGGLHYILCEDIDAALTFRASSERREVTASAHSWGVACFRETHGPRCCTASRACLKVK